MGIDYGSVRSSAAGNPHPAIGIDRGAVCRATAGNRQLTVITNRGIDRGVVRRAPAVDSQIAGIDRSAVRHTATGDMYRAVVINHTAVHCSTTVDIQMTVVINRGSCHRPIVEDIHSFPFSYNFPLHRHSAGFSIIDPGITAGIGYISTVNHSYTTNTGSPHDIQSCSSAGNLQPTKGVDCRIICRGTT